MKRGYMADCRKEHNKTLSVAAGSVTAEPCNKQRGFTLIELSIVMVALGLLIAPLFSYISAQVNIKRAIKEEAVNQRVLSALAVYAKQKGFYPCPSNPASAVGADDFGRGRDSDYSDGSGGDGVCNESNIVSVGGVFIGGLPVRELGLPSRFAANTQSWKYSYAITADLTKNASAIGVITVKEPGLVLNNITTSAPFVIVNHGPDGKGTFSLYGAKGPACGNTARDSENCEHNDSSVGNDTIFIDANFADVHNINDTDYYDDSISYTLVDEDATYWLTTNNLDANGRLNIINRNDGNVGVGDFSPADLPQDKLHVRGGDIYVQEGVVFDTSGTPQIVGGNVTVSKNVNALDVNAENNVNANNRAEARAFWYTPSSP